MRFSHPRIAPVGSALVAALVSVSMANAESTSHNTSSPNWDEVFAQILSEKISLSGQADWLDSSALGYARAVRSDAAAVRRLAQALPAVDGINGKVAGFGGGETGSNGFYGTSGSFSVPLAHQWGLQLDGHAESDSGVGGYRGGGHLFWRDPSIGLLGAYGSYEHWNGTGLISRGVNLGHIGANRGRFAAEGEYYLNRWTVSGLVGIENVSINSGVPSPSPPKRLFDDVLVSYYVTDNFKLSAGHSYEVGNHFLILGSEYGYALGGGRMASFFAHGWIGEGGNRGALGGLRIYLGQRDKTLIERHRQDDPELVDAEPALSAEGKWIAFCRVDIANANCAPTWSPR